MKSIIPIFLCVFLFHQLQAQVADSNEIASDTVIAPKVLEAFNALYKKAEISDWRIEDGNYVISFYQKNMWYDVTMSKKAKWVETYIIINFEDLPQEVIKQFEASKYNEWELVRIRQLDHPGQKLYKLLVANYRDDEVELTYNEKGELIEQANK